MKTNRFLLIVGLLTPLFAHASRSHNATQADEYFRSPSLVAGHVAMAPLHEFFDEAADKSALRNPQTLQEKNAFYCNAMSLFVSKMYNSAQYADHLSQNATHVTELLHLAGQYGLGQEAVYTGLRLFHNKLKEADIVDDTAAEHMLAEFPKLLEKFFTASEPATQKPSSLHSPAKVMENMLLAEFTAHVQQPKVELDQFFSGLARKMANAVPQQKPHDNDQLLMRERLRTQVVSFLEQVIGKTMWYPQNYESIWDSVTSMAHHIHMLGANGVLNHSDDIDNLHWSLVHRFSFFLDQYGARLPRSFFATIRDDIERKQVFFLNAPELDDGINTKRKTLLDALTRAEAKAVAFTHGILSDDLPEHSRRSNHNDMAANDMTMINGGFSGDIATELEHINQGPPQLMLG
ncbi:MAG: hypothetical protein PVJ92_03290 [Candidatus Dependentiae bacterium]